MYQVGDLVIYGSSGVCRVSAVGKPGVSYVDEGKDYYTLSPLYGTEVIYAPGPWTPPGSRSFASSFFTVS